jgi:hypothetical protein
VRLEYRKANFVMIAMAGFQLFVRAGAPAAVN